MIAPYSGGSFLQSAIGQSAQAAQAPQPQQPGNMIQVGQTPQIPQRPSPYPQPFQMNYSNFIMPGQAPMQPKPAQKSNLALYVQAARAEMARRRAGSV